MKDQEKLLKRANSALLDINRGYSVLNASGRDFYFRHFTLLDALQMDEEYDKALAHAQRSGIKSEKELIEQAIKRKSWSIQKEEEIKSLEWTIDKMILAEKKMSDAHMKKSALASIDAKRNAIKDIQEQRKKITSYSAENLSESRRIKYLVESTCFKDRGFSEPVDEDLFFEHSIACFSKIGEFNDKNFILNVAYNTAFFELFVLSYRQPEVLFKNAGLGLTVFQKNLLVYANSLLNKFKNVSIPDNIAKDPVKILEYDEKDGKTGKTSQGVDDLKEKMKSRGGVLKPEDFLT